MSEEQKQQLRQFSRYITHILRPSLIRDFLTEFLDEESVEMIISKEKESTKAAAQMLLEKMWDLQVEGWFQAFLDILLASEYTGLHAAITDWDFKDLERLNKPRLLLEKIDRSITKNIKPTELLPHLSDCLRQRECEEIRALKAQLGDTAASERLLEFLKHSDKPNWFKSLKLALENCEQHPALTLLDPDFNGKCEEKCSDESEEVMASLSIQFREDGEGDGDLQSNNPLSVTKDGGSETVVGVMECERVTERKLREYQKELAVAANAGHNTIICAPTGCGKTIVALEICENHLKKLPEKAKVVFMATKVEVYEQQHKLFKEHFSKDPDIRVSGLCGDMGELSLSTLVSSSDVLVLTPQILVNALESDCISLNVFTLLLLDECHNTTGKHPYNILMNRYIDTKQSAPTATLPQVVGLTASVGIGNFKSESEAELNICQLCANLDVRIISTVQTHLEELRRFVHTPEKVFCAVAPRTSDPFIRIISNIMRNIEQLAMKVHNIATLSQVQKGDYGSQMYEQWIVDVQKRCMLLQMTDPEEETRVCRALYTYTEHLRKYNDTLIINEDARTKDALDFLQSFILDINNANFDPTERQLTNLYQAQHEQLLHLANEGDENPKLEELKFILSEEYHNNEQTRTVLFVRTRALTDALKKWVNETESLKFLKPEVLIGRGKRSQMTGSGMTGAGQRSALEAFKNSTDIKMLIATSVADEGIDIPQCNLVIMYEYVGNVVKMVQVRGRGRAQGSRCFLVSSRQERIEKEKLNVQRERLVDAAVRTLQTTPQQLHAKVDRFQKTDIVMRLHVNLNVQKPLTKRSFQLKCAKCKNFVCSSDDLRVLKDAHHIVLDRSIFQRCITKPHHKIINFSGLTKKEKMYCAQCNRDWGITASYLNIQDLPLLKIDGFIFQDVLTNKLQVFKKWRDVPFKMEEFDVSDISVESWEPRL